MQGDFGEKSAVRKVVDTKNQRLTGTMDPGKSIISDTGDTIRNSLLRVANTISGCSGAGAISEIWKKLKTVSPRGRFWEFAR